MIPALALAILATFAMADDRPTVLVVVGAPGTPEYGAEFRRWAGLWKTAADAAGSELVQIGLGESEAGPDRDRLKAALAEQASGRTGPLWLVLIGHGTSSGRETKFNLRGPDVSDAELSDWLQPLQRPLAVLDCTSASGPFLTRLSKPGRVVVSATRGGDEQNFARFGQYLAEAIGDGASDLDKDGQVSLLEAYIVAGGRTAEFYRSRSRLATEHALLDDNGDRLGTPADWFRGVRAIKTPKDGAKPDGTLARQWHLLLNDREKQLSAEARARRDALERSASELLARKSQMPEDAYFTRLQEIMTEIARLYREHHLLD